MYDLKDKEVEREIKISDPDRDAEGVCLVRYQKQIFVFA